MIPGLKSIEEETTPEGKTKIIFNIDDDQTDDFFNFLMLEKNDTEGFQRLITDAINAYLIGNHRNER